MSDQNLKKYFKKTSLQDDQVVLTQVALVTALVFLKWSFHIETNHTDERR